MDPTDSDLGKQTTCLSLPVANCDGSTVTFLFFFSPQNSHKNQSLDKVKARGRYKLFYKHVLFLSVENLWT